MQRRRLFYRSDGFLFLKWSSSLITKEGNALNRFPKFSEKLVQTISNEDLSIMRIFNTNILPKIMLFLDCHWKL